MAYFLETYTIDQETLEFRNPKNHLQALIVSIGDVPISYNDCRTLRHQRMPSDFGAS